MITRIYWQNILFSLSLTFDTKYTYNIQVTATDGDKDRPQNIVYFLTGQGIDPDNPANSKFDINRTTGEIFVLKVSNKSIIRSLTDLRWEPNTVKWRNCVEYCRLIRPHNISQLLRFIRFIY